MKELTLMRRILRGSGLALLALGEACGGDRGSVREVQGTNFWAWFALSANENRIAEQDEQRQPPPTVPAERCSYWTGAQSNAQASYPGSKLAAWAQAKAKAECSTANDIASKQAQPGTQEAAAAAETARQKAEAAAAEQARQAEVDAKRKERELANAAEDAKRQELDRQCSAGKPESCYAVAMHLCWVGWWPGDVEPANFNVDACGRVSAWGEALSYLHRACALKHHPSCARETKLQAEQQQDQSFAQQQDQAQDEHVVRISKGYLLSHLKSPASTTWVSITKLDNCRSGVITKHTIDSQNGFGAMIRDTWIIYVAANPANKVLGCSLLDKHDLFCNNERGLVGYGVAYPEGRCTYFEKSISFGDSY